MKSDERWQTWVLGIFALLLIAWAGRAEGYFSLVTRLDERLSAIQQQLNRIETVVSPQGK